MPNNDTQPQRVQLPDGNVAEFPAYMTQEEMTAILRKQYPPATELANAQSPTDRDVTLRHARSREGLSPETRSQQQMASEGDRSLADSIYRGMGAVGEDVKGVLGGIATTSADPTAIAKRAIDTGADVAMSNEDEKQAGYGRGYRGAAALGRISGLVNPTGMEESAARGDVAGVAGHTVVPAVMGTLAAKGLEEPVTSALDEVPGMVDNAKRFPSALARGAKAAVMGKDLDVVTTAKAATPFGAGATMSNVVRPAGPLGTITPTGTGPSTSTGPAVEFTPGKGLAKAPKPAPTASTPFGENAPSARAGSEGTFARWTNERVVAEAKKGDRNAIMEARARGFEVPGMNLVGPALKKGASRAIVPGGPEGYPGPRMGESAPGMRMSASAVPNSKLEGPNGPIRAARDRARILDPYVGDPQSREPQLREILNDPASTPEERAKAQKMLSEFSDRP